MNIHSPTTEAPPKLQDVFESIWPETAYVFFVVEKTCFLQPNQKPTKVVVPSPWRSTSARPFKAISMVRYLRYFSVYASSGYPCHNKSIIAILAKLYWCHHATTNSSQQYNITFSWVKQPFLSLDLFRQFRVDQPDQCLKILTFNSNP